MHKVTILGRVGKDPEVRTFDNGNQIANFTMADTQRGYTKKDGTVIPDRTEWFNISVGGGLVGVVEKYVHKGDLLYIEGKQNTREYTDKSGEKKFFVEIRVDTLELIGGRKDSNNDTSNDYQEPQVQTEDDDDLPF